MERADSGFHLESDSITFARRARIFSERPAEAFPSVSSNRPAGRPALGSRWTKFVAGALFSLALIAVGIVIMLELNKGTLRIECEADSASIRILQDGELYEKLTVTKSGRSVRLAAGEYVIEIDGETSRIDVDGGTVTLSRRGEETVRIVYSDGDGNVAEYQPSDLSEIIASLVSVSYTGNSADATVVSTGKGWVIDSVGTIVVPSHLAPDGNSDEAIEIKYSNGLVCRARRKRTVGDFVLLMPVLSAADTWMPLESSTQVDDGESVSAVFALTDIKECSVIKAHTSIVVSEGPGWKIHPPLRFDNVIETDLETSPHTLSGAPLVTRDGKVAGMLINVRDGRLLAIPANVILKLRERSLHLMEGPFEFPSDETPEFAVIGAVKAPGRYAFPDAPLRLVDAIANAGGLSSRAGDDVLVMRSTQNENERVVIRTTINEILGSSSSNLLLTPGDLISIKVSDAASPRPGAEERKPVQDE